MKIKLLISSNNNFLVEHSYMLGGYCKSVITHEYEVTLSSKNPHEALIKHLNNIILHKTDYKSNYALAKDTLSEMKEAAKSCFQYSFIGDFVMRFAIVDTSLPLYTEW